MPRYKICFACTYPDEPGCGCPDNDFYAEHEFEGTHESAEKEAKRISREIYMGDFVWWINEAKSKTKRLVMLSGPAGVGKGPIIEWTKKLHLPNLSQVKVRKTKTERHRGTEDDLGFDKGNENYHSFDCRGAEQRIYIDELDSALEDNDVVLLETYYKAFDFLKNRYESSVDLVSVFISPLNRREFQELIEQGHGLEDYLPDLMLDSLIRRAERDGKAFSHSLIKELVLRAQDSCTEMRFAHNYRHVIPNHCYESDPRWKLPILIGEPRRVVDSLSEIIQTGDNGYVDNGSDYRFLVSEVS